VDKTCAIKLPYTAYKESIMAYANAILMLYEDEVLRHQMSKAGKKLFEEKYTWNTKGLILMKIYNQISIN
jgi:glycosyltransferase involved in cell wall biosynthesis